MPYVVVLVGCMLVCTLGMGAMMWLMMRGMGGGSHPINPINPINSSSVMDALPAPVTDMRQANDGRDAEIAELRAHIEDLESHNRALQGEPPASQDAGSMSSTIGDMREGELAR